MSFVLCAPDEDLAESQMANTQGARGWNGTTQINTSDQEDQGSLGVQGITKNEWKARRYSMNLKAKLERIKPLLITGMALISILLAAGAGTKWY